MMIIRYIFLVVLITMSICVEAQVGIGNPNPDTSSVLDLSNSSNKGILFPKAVTTAAMSATVGMAYYNNNYIYYRQSGGYNALSPWKFKFNGDVSNNVYYNLNGNIGIGNTDITTAPLAPLQIEVNKPIDLVENGSFLIGTAISKNITFNSVEIQSRDAGVGSDLTVNEQGGDVFLGSETYLVSIKSTSKVKEYDHPSHTYYDLIPAGSIIMWHGSTASIPIGWALCDGNDYQRSDNSGIITTPDLSGRFVISIGDNGGSSYSAHDIGGQDAVSLTVDQIPSHNHTGTTGGAGIHSHDIPDAVSYTGGSGSSDNNGSDGESIAVSKTDYAGNHSHSITIYNAGNSAGHENRPKYYALTYIIKL